MEDQGHTFGVINYGNYHIIILERNDYLGNNAYYS